MTRINVIPVEELSNQHLMAEWREIFHIPRSLNRTLNSKKGLEPERISSEYLLGTGHVYFFFDKMSYLLDRHKKIYRELLRRGYKIVYKEYLVDPFRRIEYRLKEYTPSEKDLEVNRKRIREKLEIRPGWYRFPPAS
jgi:deoxyribonuclease (pyrimidine dimer)